MHRIARLSYCALCYCFVYCGLAACSGEGTNRPEQLISEPDMVQLMADIHVAEVQVSELKNPQNEKDQIFQRLEMRILEKHGIDSLTFKQSYDFYLKDGETLKRIYQGVVDTLKNRNQQSLMQ